MLEYENDYHSIHFLVHW